ncbi:MAG: hypothetical protein P1V51_20050 [Deltaproteobacteria bacterium]|nr:hypothetical protein [Deltaproteobacteria bacterium]
MAMPAFTPDGVTKNVDVRPSTANLGTVTMGSSREVIVATLPQSPKAKILQFSAPAKWRLIEFL